MTHSQSHPTDRMATLLARIPESEVAEIEPSGERSREDNSPPFHKESRRSSFRFHSDSEFYSFLERTQRMSDSWFIDSIHEESSRIEDARGFRPLRDSTDYDADDTAASNDGVNRFLRSCMPKQQCPSFIS